MNANFESDFDDREFFDDEFDEEADAYERCSGWFDQGHFVCGAVGSEDCDECPCYKWLGLTNAQIDQLEFDDQ